jgi:hypothetical protein
MADIKHLIKLYSEFKKINKPKGYVNGGLIKGKTPTPEDFGKSNKAAFDPDDSEVKKYYQDAPPSTASKDIDKNSDTDETIQRLANRRSLGYDENGNQVGPQQPPSAFALPKVDHPTVSSYAEGGQVKPHKKQNLERLKQAFNQFISEEENEKHYYDGTSDGNPVGSGQNNDINNSMFAPGATSKPDMMTYDDRTSAAELAQQQDPNSIMNASKSSNATPGAVAPAQPGQDPAAKAAYDKEQAALTSSLNNYYGGLKSTKVMNKGGKVKGYDDGGEVIPDEQSEALDVQDEIAAELQKGSDDNINRRRETGLVKAEKDQQSDDGDAFQVRGTLPTKENKVETEDLDKKAIEKPYDNEEEATDLAVDDAEKNKLKEESEDSEESREPSSDENTTEEPSDEEKSNIDEKGFSGKMQGFSSNDLAKAQRERDLNIASQNFAKYGTLLGSGISKTDPSQILGIIKDSDKNVGMPVQKYAEQLQNQQNDPSSPVSKVVGQYLTQKGFNLPPNTSASDAFKVMPFLQKDMALQNAMQRSLLASNTKKDVAASNQSSMDKRADKSNEIKKEANNISRDQKASANQDKTLAQTKTMLESARGNAAVQQAQKDLYSSKKVNSLFNIYPNLDDIPDAQVNQVISEVAKIAQGGVPPGHEQDSLRPNTPESKLAKLWGQLTNKPNGASLGAYLKEFKKYNDVLANDAQDVIKDKFGRVIESSKKQLGDENYKSLQEQYMKPFQDLSSAKGNHAPGSVVSVKGKKYMVGPDGDSLQEVK